MFNTKINNVMKTVTTFSRQICVIGDIRIERITEYILDNGNNCFEYFLTKLIDNCDSYGFKPIGTKRFEFQAYNNLYIKNFIKLKKVEYTDELIEKLVKSGIVEIK